MVRNVLATRSMMAFSLPRAMREVSFTTKAEPKAIEAAQPSAAPGLPDYDDDVETVAFVRDELDEFDVTKPKPAPEKSASESARPPSLWNIPAPTPAPSVALPEPTVAIAPRVRNLPSLSTWIVAAIAAGCLSYTAVANALRAFHAH